MTYGGSTMAQEVMTGMNKLLWSQNATSKYKTKRKGEKIMMYELFIEKVVEAVKNEVGTGFDVTVNKVTKNNNLVLDGLVIKATDTNIAPTIYLNGYYERYEDGAMELSDVVESILDTYSRHNSVTFDISTFTDFDAVKNRICYKLVNTASNKKLLEDVPHRELFDLSIVYYVVVSVEANVTGSIIIHNNHIKLWDITENDLYEFASDNTKRLLPAGIKSMFDTLSEMVDMEDLANTDDFMYVLTNKEKLQGASTILYPDVLSTFAEKKNANLWLLPSSIHEWIIICDDGNMNRETLSEMIQEVNSTQLAVDEILSDHPYYYNRTTKVLSA